MSPDHLLKASHKPESYGVIIREYPELLLLPTEQLKLFRSGETYRIEEHLLWNIF